MSAAPITDDAGALRVALEGELTIYRAHEIRDRLLQALGSGQSVELDLSAVSEIDSAGLQMLMAARRDALAQGTPLTLVGHSPAVREVFALMNVAAWFGDPIVEPAPR